MPSPASTRTTTTNSRRCWPVDSSMAGLRYLSRRTGRSQNGIAGRLPAAPVPSTSPERRVAPAPNHPVPPAGRDVLPFPSPAPPPDDPPLAGLFPDVLLPDEGLPPDRAFCRTGGCAGLVERAAPELPPRWPLPVGADAGAEFAGRLAT